MPHVIKLFIDRFVVIGLRLTSPIFIRAFATFLSRIIFALPSPQGPQSRALERPRASFAQNFAITSTSLSPLPRLTTNIISKRLFRGAGLQLLF